MTTPARTGYAVVIVTHNHAETLEACLAAVARLNPSPDAVVLIDNASDDASVVIAENRGLQTIREERNTGFAAAVNRGLAETEQPWVLLLNPDCALQPDFLSRIFTAVNARSGAERIGSVTGRLMRADGPSLEPTGVVDAAGMVVSPSGRHFDRGAGAEFDDRYEGTAWVFGGTGAATLFSRAALVDVAYRDGQIMAETFFAYREDAELAWRLQLRGWSCLYVGSAIAVHRRGFRPEKGRRGHDVINFHSVKNRFLMRWHCADLGWHLRSFPMWLVRDLAVIVACLTVERESLPALRAAWRLRGDARERRRWVLGRRTIGPRQMQRWFRRQGYVEEIEG